jgi:hypothetical protein
MGSELTQSTRPGSLTAPIAVFIVGAALVVTRYPAWNSNIPTLLGAVLILGSVVLGVVSALARGDRNQRPSPVEVGPAAHSTNGFAVESLVLGVVGVSLLAIVFGHVGRSQIKHQGQSGKGMATAGLILGYLGIIVSMTLLVVVVVAISGSTY